MSEMVERVARVVDPVTWAFIDKNEGTSSGYRTAALALGRAAIQAMRDPTDAMIAASQRELSGVAACRSKYAYQDMIDEALR